jgi:hypothetical protein
MLPTLCRISRGVLVLPCVCFALAAQLIGLAASAASPVKSQQGSPPAARITGPTLGFLFDAKRGALFRIPGIAGAASLGDRLDVGVRLSRAVVGPQQDFALATRAGDREALLIRFVAGGVALSPLGETTAGVDRIALSPVGFSTALYHAAQRKLTIVSGLPLAPVIIRRIDTSGLRGELTALAIGDNPDQVLVASVEGESGSVVAVRPDGSFVPIYTGGRVTAVRFLDGGYAALADASLQRIYLVSGVSSQAALELLLAEQHGIAAPVAIETSRDSRLLFIANADSGVITTLDLSSRQSEPFSCQCRPTRLDRLTGDSVFQLTDPSEQPLKLFDAGARGPRVLMIPGISALFKQPLSPPRARTRSREARQ